MHIPQEVRELITPELARRFRAIPISDDGFSINIAIDDPLNLETMDSLPQLMGRDVIFSVATRSAVESRLNEFYRDLSVPEETDGLEGEDAPIIRLVQQMLTDAFKMRASDIHIEPMENRLRIRYRVDGKLVEVATHPKKLLSPIIARLKVMSTTMSIAEKRMPQDGRIQMSIGGKQIDLRVSSVPSNHGESIVMRILDKSALVLGLPQLGFFSDDEAVFDRLITLPDGIILVTGPTGSGKTTTLYACLNHINRPDKKNHHGGRPCGIRTLRHQSGHGKGGYRHDLRRRPARHAPPGSQHHHDRGNSRHGNSQHRHQRLPDGAPRILHPPHQ